MSKLKCKKNNFRILRKQYAYLQTILKTTVKFQKDSPKTVGGVADTRYILHIHICSIRARKMSKLKCKKNNFRILRKQYAYLQTILKTTVKFQKDSPKTVGGVADTRYILHIHICSIRARKMSKLKMRKN